MNRLALFLALFFGSLLCAPMVFARGSLFTWPHANNPIIRGRTGRCLYAGCGAGHLSRRPWIKHRSQLHLTAMTITITTGLGAKSAKGQNRRLTAASYRRRDFLRMLAGGYAVGGHPEPFVTPDTGTSR